MKKWIISAILLAFAILFVCIKSVWTGFIYFSASFLALLCIMWVVLLTYYYILDYYKYFDEDFRDYKAFMVNHYNITTQDFEANIEFYIKKYKKSLRRDKIIDIGKILFILVIGVSIIVVLFKA